MSNQLIEKVNNYEKVNKVDNIVDGRDVLTDNLIAYVEYHARWSQSNTIFANHHTTFEDEGWSDAPSITYRSTVLIHLLTFNH